MTVIVHDFEARTRLAVKTYWSTLASQATRQSSDASRADHGNRMAVTGGKQMDGFCAVVRAGPWWTLGWLTPRFYKTRGLSFQAISGRRRNGTCLCLEKAFSWQLSEFKSQRGPSFGNNFNNRTEEAVGVANDIYLWPLPGESFRREEPRAPGSDGSCSWRTVPGSRKRSRRKGAPLLRAPAEFPAQLLRETVRASSCADFDWKKLLTPLRCCSHAKMTRKRVPI